MSTPLDVGTLRAHLDVDKDRWDPQLRGADRDLERLGRQGEEHLDRVGEAFKQAGDDAEKMSGRAVAAGEEMSQRLAAAQLRLTRSRENEADALRAVIRASDDLDFERIGGDSDKLTAAQGRLDAALRAAARSMRETAAAGKDLGKLEAEFERSGADAGTQFGKGAASKIALLAPVLVPGASLAGGAAAAALVAGWGLGIIGVGALTASTFEHVKQEWAEFGEFAKARSQAIFAPFGQSLLDIREIAADTFDGLAPALERSTAVLAPRFTELTRDISRALLELEPAFDPMTRAADRVLDVVGDRLPDVVTRLSRGMTELADSIAENPEAIGDLIDAAGGLIEVALELIATLNDLYATIREPVADAWNWMEDAADQLGDWLTVREKAAVVADQHASAEARAGETLDRTRASQDEVAAAMQRSRDAAELYRETLDDLTDATYDQMSADLRLRDAVDSVEDATREYSEAVRDHGVRSEEAQDALRDLQSQTLRTAEAARDNAYAQQTAAGRARDTIGANLAARDQLLNLASTLRGPARDAVMAQVAALDALISRLRSVAGTYTAKVQVVVTQTGRYTGPPIGAQLSFARGGSIKPGEIGRVAEYEPEVLDAGGKSYLMMPPNMGGYITPVSEMQARSAPAPARGPADTSGPAIGNYVEQLIVKSYSDRFSYAQVMQDLAWQGVR